MKVELLTAKNDQLEIDKNRKSLRKEEYGLVIN